MTKQQVLKQLEMILVNVEKAANRAERLSKKIDIPSHSELCFIKKQLEDLIELGKEKIK